MAEIGENISDIEPKAIIAKEIVALEDQIEDNKELSVGNDELANMARSEIYDLQSKIDDLRAKLA
jgi:protein subunit release factor A